jgi:Uma2 family endonuclease
MASASQATSVLFEELVEVPLSLGSLADFRRWALSDAFPDSGRIDFIDGRIEVDMVPEDIFCHGTLKTEIARIISHRVKRGRMGHLLIDKGRVSCPAAELSVEPDIVFLSHETIRSGRVHLTPKAGGQQGRYVEIVGPPDLIVEIVSDSSDRKSVV